jgi:hypothetical protein
VEQFDHECKARIPGEGPEADPLDGALPAVPENLKYIDMHQFFLVRWGQYVTGDATRRLTRSAMWI